jgi:PAS domain S-box-containing protein
MLVLGVAYAATALVSLQLALVERNVTPLWPPTGIAVVAFLAWGSRIWPGVAVAAFFVNLPISTSPLAAAATAAGNTVAPLVAAAILRRVSFRMEIDRLRDAIAIVFAALASTLLSASIGAGTLVFSGAVPESGFPEAWAVWWTGDAMGVLVVTPFLLSLRTMRNVWPLPWSRRLEAVALFVILAVASVAVFRTALPIAFVVLPLVGWAAWRFQLIGAGPAGLVVVGIAVWSATVGLPAFREASLPQTMLTLQAFNATVAFTCLFLAALVAERVRAREALERAAGRLEEQVRERTMELSTANRELTREIADRKEAVETLRQRERQLAEAQQMARLGSWEWVLPEDKVTWSDEMYLIHGYRPQEFPMTFDRAVGQVVKEDVPRIRANIETARGRGEAHNLPDIEYRITRTDGEERVLLGRARLELSENGEPIRMVGTVQDVTEGKQAEREHRIAETLQRSLLLKDLPDIPGVSLAARYVPATSDVEVGGDWYDVLELPGGQIAFAVGDVAGHGLQAASTMGQLRMAVRSYALEDPSPSAVLERLDRLMFRLGLSEMATVVFVVLDQASGTVRLANAGHPPPLLLQENGEVSFVEGSLAPPVGVSRIGDRVAETERALDVGATLLLFTDGLVERRDASLQDRLMLLKEEAATAGPEPEALCDHLLRSLVGDGADDDVALLALRRLSLADRPLDLRIPAEPQALAPVRRTMRRWLEGAGATTEEANDVLLAVGEACANVVQHAYGLRAGRLELRLAVSDGEVEVTVRDTGSWRSASETGGGRGMEIMRGLMDSVEMDNDSEGTVVRMRRRLGDGQPG